KHSALLPPKTNNRKMQVYPANLLGRPEKAGSQVSLPNKETFSPDSLYFNNLVIHLIANHIFRSIKSFHLFAQPISSCYPLIMILFPGCISKFCTVSFNPSRTCRNVRLRSIFPENLLSGFTALSYSTSRSYQRERTFIISARFAFSKEKKPSFQETILSKSTFFRIWILSFSSCMACSPGLNIYSCTLTMPSTNVVFTLPSSS